MTLDSKQIGHKDLMAFFDGQLDESDRAIVERYLANHSEKAEEQAVWRRQTDAIHALYGGVAHEPVPERLNPHILASRRGKSRTTAWRMAAAAAALLLIGAGFGWVGRGIAVPDPSAPQALITAAVDAHDLFVRQKRHPVEVSADQSAHLTTWLSASLDRRLVMPDLTDVGYSLVGGRLLPFGAASAAQIMYESGDRRITLYLTPKLPAEPKANRYERVGGLAALYWANDAVTCTIVGDLSRAHMEEIASEVFSALNWQSSDYRRG